MERDGKIRHEAVLGDSQAKVIAPLGVGPGNRGCFRGGGYSSTFLSRGGMPVTISRINLVKGFGRVCGIGEVGAVRPATRSTPHTE